MVREFPLHAVFTDGSLIHTRSTDSEYSILTSNYSKRYTSKGGAAMVLLGPLENWKASAPIVLTITVSALQFPGINAYVVEVLAQRLAFTPTCPSSILAQEGCGYSY
jgi:hypothetical protein